jgi:hypothetical protein
MRRNHAVQKRRWKVRRELYGGGNRLRFHWFGPEGHWTYWEWWLGAELNRRHKDFQSSALPTELPSQSRAVIELGFAPDGKAEFSCEKTRFTV